MILHELSAGEAIRQIRNGEITSEELVHGCLNQIEKVDATAELKHKRNEEAGRRQRRPPAC